MYAFIKTNETNIKPSSSNLKSEGAPSIISIKQKNKTKFIIIFSLLVGVLKIVVMKLISFFILVYC
tara:strand:+ start:75 stop:272 length:198 start_codon:yes stop_codon:yes gene_type:complete